VKIGIKFHVVLQTYPEQSITELPRKIVTTDEHNLFIHHFISSTIETEIAKISLDSTFPWNGDITIKVEPKTEFELLVRIPSWVNNPEILINGKPYDIADRRTTYMQTASGFSPKTSYYLKLEHPWASGDEVKIWFPMNVRILGYHKRVRKYQKRGTLTRGPLVYCLEDIDNLDIDIFNCVIEKNQKFEIGNMMKDYEDIITISGKTKKGRHFVAIPYFFWGNRGLSKMNAVLKFT
jgi:DUF1680 family protein